MEEGLLWRIDGLGFLIYRTFVVFTGVCVSGCLGSGNEIPQLLWNIGVDILLFVMELIMKENIHVEDQMKLLVKKTLGYTAVSFE